MIWVLLILVVLCVGYYISTFNGFIRLQNMIEEAFSTMDVYLVKRAELIPNLVNVVKGYAKHETETLEKVIAARNAAQNASSNADKIEAENNLSGAIKSIFALSESYPELKADNNFLLLQKQLNDIENDVANSRKYYNGVVRQYNTKIQSFPSSLIANAKGFVRQPLFEVSDDRQRDNVTVEF
ncbi:MAG: LemA family protein [Erysipelotrichaceae bacterium]|nr:LemA family protein [Erysipelotrichaceae bacterium]